MGIELESRNFEKRSMKIRAKLIFLVIGVVLLSLVAIGVYLALLAPVGKIRVEEGYLVSLNDAIKDQLIELNPLPYALLSTGQKFFSSKSKAVDEAFRNLARIKDLPKINRDIQSELEVIANLQVLNDERLATLKADFDIAYNDAKTLFIFPDSVHFTDFYDYMSNPAKKVLAGEAVMHLGTFISDLTSLQDSLNFSRQTIGEQYAVIDREIAALRARALGLAIAIVAGILALTVALALAFANGIAETIIRMERNISKLKEGDISERAVVTSRDEIGLLARNLNLFLDGLASALLRIKGISGANIEAKSKLADAVTKAASSTTRIESNTRSIGRQVENLDASVIQSAGSIGKIVDSIAGLKEQIEGQSAMVEESTASVTQMLASLENMTRVTERDRLAAEELVQVLERGRSVFETAFTKVSDIPEYVGTIRDMAGVIRNIASQTNLLAMNAAIEAAHAGDAGRGFAVVADEIRKLSEKSNASSKDISDSIKIIVGKIDETIDANKGTSQAFSAIDGKIREVTKSTAELYASISEIQAGSNQILRAMVDLQERSARVKDGAESMDEGSTEIKEMMMDLTRISTDVASNISEIVSEIEEIGVTLRSVAEFEDMVSSGSGRLDEEVSRFKTSAEGSPIQSD